MKKKIIMLSTALAALILELLPYGAVCNFANPDGEPWRRTFSYFDLTPFGYANFSPFIVALLTICLIALIIIAIITKKSFHTPILTVSAISTILSFAPLLLGIKYFSIVGALISIMLLSTSIIACIKKD